MQKRAGFTKIEAAATLLVLSLAVGIFLFGYGKTVQKGGQAACTTCRSLLVRLYQTHALAGCDCTLEEAIAGGCESFNSLVTGGTTCPAGGVYTAIGNDSIVCSKHG